MIFVFQWIKGIGMNKKFSIADGYQIVMLFLTDFWWNFLKGVMIERGLIYPKISQFRNQEGQLVRASSEDELHRDNDFFFLSVCDGTSDDYFANIIERKLDIPKPDQSGINIDEETVFQLAIDFCNYFNTKYQEEKKDPLRFAIDWLEDMRNHPQKHKTEWNIWNKTIINVIDNGQKSLGFF